MKKTIRTLLIFSFVFSFGATSVFAFSDTQVHWAKETIDWAEEKGVAKGYPDGTFKPNNHVTEAEFLAMLVRTYEGEKAGNSHWADGYYTFARLMNYPTYGSEDVNKRSWLITRTQVAEIVAGTQGVNYTGNDAIHYLLLHGLARGKDPNNLTIASFEGDATLTRAEAVQFIKNVLENGLDKLQPRPTKLSQALPKIGVNDRIIPLVPVDELEPKPQEPAHPGQSDIIVRTPTGEGHFLLERDPVTYPWAQEWADHIRIEDGKVKGIVPNIPSTHNFRMTTLNNPAQDLSHYPRGQAFEFEIKDYDRGYIHFVINEVGDSSGKSSVRMNFKDGTIVWGNK